MKAAIFPGSFDPVTLGHLDIIERASRLFDRLIVVILENSEKHATFSIVNQHIAPEVETVLLYASPEFSYVSSSIIRELVKYGQDISAYVPKDVMEAFVNR